MVRVGPGWTEDACFKETSQPDIAIWKVHFSPLPAAAAAGIKVSETNGSKVSIADVAHKKHAATYISVRSGGCSTRRAPKHDWPLWAEAAWKPLFVVDFDRSGGGGHGGFHRGRRSRPVGAFP